MKKKKIIYIFIVCLLLISFVWLYTLKLNLNHIDKTAPKNGIGVSEFKNQLKQILNQPTIFDKNNNDNKQNTSTTPDQTINDPQIINKVIQDYQPHTNSTSDQQVKGLKTKKIKTLPQL